MRKDEALKLVWQWLSRFTAVLLGTFLALVLFGFCAKEYLRYTASEALKSMRNKK